MKINMISIENCTYCDADCVMCVRRKYKGPLKCMEQDLFQRCVDESVSIGTEMINICGFGEALLDPELNSKLAYIKNRYPNIKTALTTTGYKMQGKILDTMCEYLDEINFSMYGINEKTYEAVHRGRLKYSENKQNIDELISRKKRPYVIMSYLDMEINHAEMEAWIKYYESKADQINIWKLNRWPHSGNVNMDFKSYLPCRCFRIDTMNGMYIKVDGEVSPCCYDYNTELSLGNIRENSLENILCGETVKKLKHMQEKDLLRNSNMICGDCDQLYSREGALVYTTNRDMKVGRHSFMPKQDIYGI